MLFEQIKTDIKQAMVEKDEVRKNTLRMVVNSTQMMAKEGKQEITDELTQDAIKKELKQANQAMDILKQEGKMEGEFYEKTKRQIELLSSYLPKQLSKEEIKEEIRKLMAGQEMTNKGLIMKTVMPVLKPKADGKLINEAVTELLNE